MTQVTGEWKGVTAGGCTNHPQTYPNNPVYQLQLAGPAAASVTLQLKGPRVYQVRCRTPHGIVVTDIGQTDH